MEIEQRCSDTTVPQFAAKLNWTDGLKRIC